MNQIICICSASCVKYGQATVAMNSVNGTSWENVYFAGIVCGTILLIAVITLVGFIIWKLNETYHLRNDARTKREREINDRAWKYLLELKQKQLDFLMSLTKEKMSDEKKKSGISKKNNPLEQPKDPDKAENNDISNVDSKNEVTEYIEETRMWFKEEILQAAKYAEYPS